MKNLIEADGVPLIQLKGIDGVWHHRGLSTEELRRWYIKKIENLKGVTKEEENERG